MGIEMQNKEGEVQMNETIIKALKFGKRRKKNGSAEE